MLVRYQVYAHVDFIHKSEHYIA